MSLKNVIAIVGPTGSGKSALAFQMAQEQGGSIVSCDSVQVYKGFDIGSAKPTQEERQKIPHYLIDVVEANENFDAALFRQKALEAIQEIESQGRVPFVVGGTLLYFKALCGQKFHDLPRDEKLRSELKEWSNEKLYQTLVGVDPQRAREIHLNDHFRLARACEIAMLSGQTMKELTTLEQTEHPKLTILCEPPSEILEANIRRRTQQMLDLGLIDEVRTLLAQGLSPLICRPLQSIGYKQVCEFLSGQIENEKALFDAIGLATRQFARKQRMGWKGVEIDQKWDGERFIHLGQ